MKYRDLVEELKKAGFIYVRANKHNIFSNGVRHIAVPHGKEINRMLSQRILKEARRSV